MDSFLNVFGNVTISRATALIAALLFLVGCYRKVSTYFKEKAINDYKQNQEIQKVIDQSQNYPKWRQQSLDIQQEFNDRIQNLNDKMDQLSYANKEGMAYTWRYRILRFDDEIRHEIRHSKEHFDQILEDIDNYESFCRRNPDYPNNKAKSAIKNVKDTYDKCVDDNSFL